MALEIQPEILSDKAGRYKRNTSAIAIVAILVSEIPGAAVSQATIFGLRAEAGSAEYVWGVLGLLLFYHFAIYAHEIHQSWSAWIPEIAKKFHGSIGLFFGRKLMQSKTNLHQSKLYLNKKPAIKGHLPKYEIKCRDNSAVGMGEVNSDSGEYWILKHARRQFIAFCVVDFIIPFALAIIGLAYVAKGLCTP